MKNQQILLVRRPQGRGVSVDDFQRAEADRIEPRDGQVEVRVIYISIDPATRLWMNEDPPVMAPLPLGRVVTAVGIGIVENSRDVSLPVGTLVSGPLGWQSYITCAALLLTVLPSAPMLPLTTHLTLLGSSGLTAYFGLLDLGEPKPGETIVVSSAAGSVGSLVGQIGKIKSCRVIGIAGGEEKCRYVKQELGFDDTIDYKNQDVRKQLDLIAPGGVDVYFDNVGGDIHDAIMEKMNEFGRVIYCGAVSSGYSNDKSSVKIDPLDNVVKALKLLGLRIDLYYSRAHEAVGWLVYWALTGQLKDRVHIINGLENAPVALNMVFGGKNRGKMTVQVSAEPEGLKLKRSGSSGKS